MTSRKSSTCFSSPPIETSKTYGISEIDIKNYAPHSFHLCLQLELLSKLENTEVATKHVISI